MDARGAFPSRTLAASGVLLGLMSLSLFLITLTTPEPVRAAMPSTQQQGKAATVSIESTTTATNTVFLPFIRRQTKKPGNIWHAEYYDNPTLSRVPKYAKEEERIDFDWDDDAPPGLPSNYFSIRWIGDWDFEVGDYTFFAYADDGMRLWLDGELLIDAWRAGAGDHLATRRLETAGLHQLKLEYFELSGDAAISLHWRRTDLYPLWSGEDFDNPWVQGQHRAEWSDPVIQFDWGEDCPEDLLPGTCNSFSVRWEATPFFEPGTHRFHIYADEGYQLYVDGGKVDEGGWSGSSGSADDTSYDLSVTKLETHEITYNFHDRGGPAEARLWIENLAYPEWTAEYFDNMSLSGSPLVTRQESAVFYDWGLDRPRPALPHDNFSVRWSGKRYFHSGCYRFGFFADDGVRLRVDGVLLVNAWQGGRGEYQSPITYLSTGYHDIVIEYFENAGEAEIRFWWE